MAQDWKKLQAQFQHDHEKYGTGAKEWCEAKGLNYQSARRYIKVRSTPQIDSAQKQSAQKRDAQRRAAQKKLQKTQVIIIDESQREKAERGEDVKGEPLRKGGIYARYFPTEKQVMFDAAFTATLDDELALTRARLQNSIEYLGKIHEDIANAENLEQRVALYESFTRLNGQLDTLTARIESLTRTMSTLGIDEVSHEKIVADTQRIRNASRKLALEADNLSKEGQGDETPLGRMLDELRKLGSGGLMNS
ncbi:hypothetical protein [Enterovibrio norvegicus]|uniref:hypothetical protein n=1 Tax=Enterovibrio norvegicus TaxID=188144 RepID=UPI0024B2208A|nr:hypothetical protein [Enterovibrio norvegicus]